MLRKLIAAAAFSSALLLSHHALATQCVPYARDSSGIDLKGNAWQWWSAAAGRYERGNAPRVGSVLVFRRQGKMRYGHIAVVSRLLSNRVVLINHANWAPASSSGRGKISHSMPIIDVSPDNDWSRVQVWYSPVGGYGDTVYRTEGFIHQSSKPDHLGSPPIHSASLSQASVRVGPSSLDGPADGLPARSEDIISPGVRALEKVDLLRTSEKDNSPANRQAVGMSPNDDQPTASVPVGRAARMEDTAQRDSQMATLDSDRAREAMRPSTSIADGESSKEPVKEKDKGKSAIASNTRKSQNQNVGTIQPQSEVLGLSTGKADLVTTARGLFGNRNDLPPSADLPLVLN